MNLGGAAFALLIAAALPAQAQPGCVSRTYARLADLPAGAVAALGIRMAERGQPFQVTDVIGPGPRLPGSRFIAARQQGCRLTIRYERGGIAHTYNDALLERRGNAWVVLRPNRPSKSGVP